MKKNVPSRVKRIVGLALSGAVMLLIAFTIVVLLVGGDVGTNPTSPANAPKDLDITVAWSGLALQVTNHGSEDAVGKTFTAYINGMPGFTYKAEATMPGVGESVGILLSQFTKKDGERFNPLTHAVRLAWVGGAGYNYWEYWPSGGDEDLAPE